MTLSPTPTASSPPQAKLLLAWGDDRPGILDEVAHYLYERGANISDSKLLSARGTFILMIVLSSDAGGLARISEGLEPLASATRIRLELRDARAEGHGETAFTYKFTAAGSDQAGVLHKVSHLLRALNVNIEDVHTRVGSALSGAPTAGTAAPSAAAAKPQFELELLLSVPRATPVVKLREYLGTLCGELGIKWDLVPA